MVIWHSEANETYMVLVTQEKYKDAAIDLSRSEWDIFLISVVFILIVISASIYYLQMRIFTFLDPNTTRTGYGEISTSSYDTSKQTEHEEILYIWERLTATEAIYEIFETNSIPREITNLIIKDYCGFSEITMNPKGRINRIRNRFLLYHILIVILITSLLFATYCGIIFMIQNEQNLDRYSVYFECQCVNIWLRNKYPLCKVKNYPTPNVRAKSADYADFYDDIWIPYLQQYEQANSSIAGGSSSDLYVAGYAIGRGYMWCSDEDIEGIDTEETEYGALYLSEKGIDDCDWVHSGPCFLCRCCAASAGCKTFASLCTCVAVALMISITVCVVIMALYWSSTTKHFIKAGLLAIIQEMDRSDAAWDQNEFA